MEWLTAISEFFSDPPRILEPDMLVRIGIQLALFLASALFSGSETALFSLTKFDLQRLERSGSPMAAKLTSLLDQPRRLIVSILCGNELVNIAAAANMTAILIELVGADSTPLIATLVMVPLILLLGEVTPKTLAVINPVWVSTRIVTRPISAWLRLSWPLANLVRAVADRTTTLIVGPERASDNILRVEDLETLIEEGVKSGEFSATERSLVQNIIAAGNTSVSQVMTPRTRVVAINGRLSMEKIRSQMLKQRHSRVPVYRENRDNIVGFLHIEDFTSLVQEKGQVRLQQLLHPALAVPPTKDVDEMLDLFDQHQARAALVVSEYGGIEGMITLQDVSQFLFAGLFEVAAPRDLAIAAVDGAFEVDGLLPVAEVSRMTGLNLNDPAVNTIAGYTLHRFGHVPSVGEQLEIDQVRVTVLAMENLRITRLRLETAEAGGEA